MKTYLKKIFYAARAALQRAQLRRCASQEHCRIIIGTGGIFQRGWVSTDIESLNILNSEDWKSYFQPNAIEAMLAEHVWEHLTREDGVRAARHCYAYLRAGGHVRVAVPDGLHPHPAYIDQVRPGSTGPGAEDHKMLYTYHTFSQVFEEAGFRVRLLEYFDERGVFHAEDWDPAQGMVHRSKRFDARNRNGAYGYTSIILDAIKEK